MAQAMGLRDLPSPLPLSRPRGRGVQKAGRGPAPQGSRPGLIYFAPTGLQHRSPSQLNFIYELLRQETSKSSPGFLVSLQQLISAHYTFTITAQVRGAS